MYLSNIAKTVTLVHRRDKLKAEAILIDRIIEKSMNGNINIIWNHRLEEIIGDETGVTGAQLIHVQNEERTTLEVAGVFIAIGHTPNTDIFAGQMEMNGGYITTQNGRDGNATQTSVPGIFAAGDVQDHVYRQAVTSAGTGCMAALDAEKFLATNE